MFYSWRIFFLFWSFQDISFTEFTCSYFLIHSPPPSSILERLFFSCVYVFVCVFPSFPSSNFILLPSLTLNTHSCIFNLRPFDLSYMCLHFSRFLYMCVCFIYINDVVQYVSFCLFFSCQAVLYFRSIHVAVYKSSY